MSSIAQASATFDVSARPLTRQAERSARPKPQAPVARVVPETVVAPTVPLTWLERLATWAEAQPPHRRLGHWTLMR